MLLLLLPSLLILTLPLHRNNFIDRNELVNAIMRVGIGHEREHSHMPRSAELQQLYEARERRNAAATPLAVDGVSPPSDSTRDSSLGASAVSDGVPRRAGLGDESLSL